MTAILQITDGTTSVDLLGNDGYILNGWRPTVAGYKGGGTFQSSSLSDGRRLVHKAFDTTVETFDLKALDVSQDALIRTTQELRRLLEKASDYWTTEWQNTPVYIVAKATRETNTRYAIIHVGVIPEDENPFSQPFLQPGCESVMDNIALIVERGHWSDQVPGVGSCVQVSGTEGGALNYPLVFDGATQDVTVPAAASLNDLPPAVMTVYTWIKADSYGEGGNGRIIVKGSSDQLTRGWHIWLSSANGLSCRINYDNTDAFATIGLDELTADGLWHLITMTYTETTVPGTITGRKIYLAVDGTWSTSYVSNILSIGNYISDAADDMIIGNNSTGTAGFNGEIGWVHVRRAAGDPDANPTFTVPPRCPLPEPDAVSAFLGIREGGGTAIDDLTTNANDGTAANDSWGDACELTFGRAATCLDEVYIANKQNAAQLTHIFVDNGGVFLGNYVDQTAYNLLPAIPAVNDAIYFGVETSIVDSGYFCSLVFDIGTAISDVTTTAWEYWNGAGWVNITTSVQDNTNAGGYNTGVAFDTTGVGSVHWEIPTAWATNDPGVGITGYWIRLRVVAIGAAPTAPTQQNRYVYSVLWPGADVDELQVPGDFRAISRVVFTNQSDKDAEGGATAPDLYGNRVVIALRSLSRGADFTPFINLADEQNNSGITVTVDNDAAFANSTESATGRQVTVTNARNGWTAQATIEFDSALVMQYMGRFRAYLRGQRTTALGDPEDFQVRLRSRLGEASGAIVGYSRLADNTDQYENLGANYVMDFGVIAMPPTDVMLESESAKVRLELEVDGDGATTAQWYDLVLMPVDEWIGDYEDTATDFSWGGRGISTLRGVLDVDAITNPKNKTRALLRLGADNSIADIYRSNATPSTLQSNADQKLWILVMANETTFYGSKPEVVGSLQMYRNSHYLSMRGDR